MRRVSAFVVLASLAAAGCSGPSDFQTDDANAQCAPHGGVLSLTNGHSGDMIVCADKVARQPDTHAGDR